ncbi:MAG: hypothetical protein H6Q25_1278 [Bacteroidetes bacterium]|nr:hypothetical protein [Bacteroidota bacterium]
MRNFIFAILALCLTAVTLSSCTDPEDPIVPNPPSNPTSYLKFGNQYYELTSGYYSSFWGTDFTCYLLGPNANYDSWLESLLGTDQGVVFSLTLPEDITDFPTGQLIFFEGGNGEELPLYSYNHLYVDTLFDFFMSMEPMMQDVKNDTIRISKIGSKYTIKYNGLTEENVPFEIKYVGLMTRNDNID